MKHLLSIFSFLLFLSICSYGQIINVPDDQLTIQSAINASVDGDTVLVADGTYFENINFSGKAITLASWFLVDGNEIHIDSTIINGSQPSHPDSGSVVSFRSGEDTTSVLYGFTITGGKGCLDPHGYGTRGAGGIVINHCGAKIQYNKITDNIITHNSNTEGGGIVIDAPNNHVLILNNNITNNKLITTSPNGEGGAGIFCYNSPNDLILIAENVISNNEVIISTGKFTGNGGGIYLSGSKAQIGNNLIKNNSAASGGGIRFYDYPGSENPNIVNNTIVFNKASSVGGGILSGTVGLTPKMINSILWGNTAPNNPQIYGNVGVEYSNVEGGITGRGNIDLDPLFADTVNYYLSSNSPCVDAGNPEAIFNDLTDPNNPGFPLFPALGGLRNDMGAYGGNPSMIWANVPSRFILSCLLNNTYQVPGSDTLIVTSKIFSPEDQSVDVKAIIENFEGNFRDSIQMFDDGTHKDSIAGDGFYTGYWQVVNSKDYYDIHMSAYLSYYKYRVLLNNAVNFTTIGPITLENYEITSTTSLPDYGERKKVSFTLKNYEITDTIFNVDVKITLPDNPLIKNTTTGIPLFADLAPGESITNTSRDFALSFLGGCTPGSYRFGLEITSNDVAFWYGTFTIDVVTGIKDEDSNLPAVFALQQNYPNPFNPSTKIKYQIQSNVKGETSNVKLIVYDILGRKVAALVNQQQKPGYYEVSWDASNNSSGIYFYKINAGTFVETKKMILLR